MNDELDFYAFKIPLLFEGDRGSGKTYDARQFAKTRSLPCLEIAGNESTEAFEFLGHVVQSQHGMVWKDGKLSQAFRMAAKGQKAVLIIDEILRIPQRHLSVLLSALSPDSDDCLRLQTGRMVACVDGIGVEEELVCPSSNLAIFATTNAGPEFAVDELDPAVAERFIIVRKDTEIRALESILARKCELKSFNKLVALRCVEFFNKAQRMAKTGTLNRHPTTRTLARAIDKAQTEQEVRRILKDQILLWVDRDSMGFPVESQQAALSRAIDELFDPVQKPARPASAPYAPKHAGAPKPAMAAPAAPFSRAPAAPPRTTFDPSLPPALRSACETYQDQIRSAIGGLRASSAVVASQKIVEGFCSSSCAGSGAYDKARQELLDAGLNEKLASKAFLLLASAQKGELSYDPSRRRFAKPEAPAPKETAAPAPAKPSKKIAGPKPANGPSEAKKEVCELLGGFKAIGVWSYALSCFEKIDAAAASGCAAEAASQAKDAFETYGLNAENAPSLFALLDKHARNRSPKP